MDDADGRRGLLNNSLSPSAGLSSKPLKIDQMLDSTSYTAAAAAADMEGNLTSREHETTDGSWNLKEWGADEREVKIGKGYFPPRPIRKL